MDRFGISTLFERDLYKENYLKYTLSCIFSFFTENMRTLNQNYRFWCGMTEVQKSLAEAEES